jgi:hypothetical protein
VNRPARPADRLWSGTLEILRGVTLTQPAGQFPGSTVAHWAAGAAGKRCAFGRDTVFDNPDRRSVARWSVLVPQGLTSLLTELVVALTYRLQPSGDLGQ